MKKFLIKYKFSFNLFIGYASLFGPLAVMVNLNQIYEISDGVNSAVGIGITVFGIVWLTYFVINYSKITKQREKDKIRKIEKIVHSQKSAVLVRKRAFIGNFSFLSGLLSFYTAWLLFFPFSYFNSAGFWIFRGCSVVLTAFGAIFSWVIPRKMLIYKGGVLIIDNGEINKSINPDELSGWERRFEKRKSSNTFAWSLYYDLALNINGEEIILKKADSEYDLCFKKTIQTIKNMTTDKPVQTEREI